MPFYLRKSVKAGPFRFNFSKNSVGVSVGIKGLRVGSGPRGHYIQAGRGGIHYRATINSHNSRRSPEVGVYHRPNLIDQPHQVPAGSLRQSGVEMIEVESGHVSYMTSVRFDELLKEINDKARQVRMGILLPCLVIALAICLAFTTNLNWGAVLPMALPAWGAGLWLDSFRRTTVLMYDLEPSYDESYKSIVQAFDGMNAADGKWHIEAGGAVRDTTTWKRNAGASHLVRKSATQLGYKLPRIIRSNITPPAMHVGKQILYFFPDMVLVEDRAKYGAIDYAQLQLRSSSSNFIEEGRVPRDAHVISHTWKHPNKSGGPDRRFNNNYQIPVCRYEALHLSSASGLNELVEFSRTGVAATFALSIENLRSCNSY
jgi:hypothetical protein